MSIGMLLALILIGVIAGAISGILGIGGGIIMVPAMVYLLGFTQQQSVATSLTIIGSYFSSKIAIGLPEHIVKKCFAVLLFVVGIKMMFFDK